MVLLKTKLPISEELDFHYLLSLMPPLHAVPEFFALPELFSIIGVDALILLCKYAGGETLKIPTIEQLDLSIMSLQYFYDCDIKKSIQNRSIPKAYRPLVQKIRSIYATQ